MAYTGLNSQPSTVRTATTHNYVSSIDLINNLHKPEIDSQLTMRLGDQSLTGFMEMMGNMNPVANIEYSHYEDEWLHEVINSTTTTSAVNPGDNVIATATDAATAAAASPYLNIGSVTDTSMYVPRANDIVQYPTGEQAVVIDVTGASFTIAPVDSTVTLPDTTGLELIVIGNVHAEGTGQPEGRNSRVSLYKNNLMIKKTSHRVTGTEMAQQTWIELKDKAGKSGYLWYFKAYEDMHKRFMNECEMTMLLGQQITNPAIGAALGEGTIISEGFIPFIENYGNTHSYAGSFGLADLDVVVKTLDRERGAKENTMWCGINLSLDIDDTFAGLFQNGAVSYGAFNNNQDLAVNMQFSSFQRGNYVFHKKTYDAFNYKKMLGATGQKFPDYAMIVPADKTVEAKTGASVPSVRINYLQGKGNGYSRDMEEWLTGGANGVYTSTEDRVDVNYRAHRGFEGFAPNRFFAISKA